MTDFSAILTPAERIALSLRALYASRGFSHYRMSKFEEYDLYSGNKDFLVSENIITFTDTDGRLLALKPDVTLSIIKNLKLPTEGVNKLYYDENVYRVSSHTGSFREIRQTGVECIGRVGTAEMVEVLSLALGSLDAVAGESVLEISHIDVVSGMLDELGVDRTYRGRVFEALGEKNMHGVREVLTSAECSAEDIEAFCRIASLGGSAGEVIPLLEENVRGERALRALAELRELVEALTRDELGDRLRIDFSVVNNTLYYNGIAFRGFASGAPTAVLIGGQYDVLMKKLGKAANAVGFAVYVDTLAGLG